MAKYRVRIRNAGLQEVKRSREMKAAVTAAAEVVAANVRSEGIRVGDRNGGPDEEPLPVEVRESTSAVATNGHTAHVVLAHPAGQAVQAKHGSLTKAAAQAGLKVRGGSA